MAPRNPQQSEVEDDILRNMTGGDDADDQILDNDDDGDEIQFTDGEEEVDNQHDTSGDDADDDDPDDRSNDEPRQQQKPGKQQPVDDRNEKFQFAEDKQGNFVDKDGNIIVKAGKSRDIFVKIKKAWQAEQRKNIEMSQQFTEVVANARELLKRYTDLKATKSLAEERGLTSEETQQAVDIAALNKIDPKAAVRKILTIAHLNGIDLSDIGVTGPVDAKTVADEAVKKYLASTQQVKKTPEEEASEEADAFLQRFPDARPHTNLIAQAKQRYPMMSLDHIWVQILLNAKPKQEQRQQTEERRDPPRRPVTRNGQRPTGGVVNGKLSLKAVDPTSSFRDIGRGILADIKALERE